jgi:beta-glucosidase/6-phospho-beta-glucosidase/beta-galactosidase
MSQSQPPAPPADTRPKEGIFPTFFMAGFECSTFIWKDKQRKDFIALTGHDKHLEKDYDLIMDLGIGTVREAIRWPLVDKGNGKYDWSTVDPVIECLNNCNIAPIWDLFHYGLPDDCDPLSNDCRKRFVDYAHACAEYVKPRTKSHDFFTPVNEITFFAGAGTDMGWMYPFAKGKYNELKRALCHMDIEAVKAIREVNPEARMVHVDPIIHAVPPPDRPDLADEAYHEAYVKAYESWDILCGKLQPELGGSPEILDIVGVNTYNFSQAEMAMGGERKILGPRDPRRKPLSEQLQFAWNRYRRPVIIGETAGWADHRATWLKDTMEECMKALLAGVDFQGVCLFPSVDIPDWNTGEWAKIGIFDVEDGDGLERCPCDPYIEEIRRWQKILDAPENIEPDSYGGAAGRVELHEVRAKAQEWADKLRNEQSVAA